jgi:hypothetical protein
MSGRPSRSKSKKKHENVSDDIDARPIVPPDA